MKRSLSGLCLAALVVTPACTRSEPPPPAEQVHSIEHEHVPTVDIANVSTSTETIAGENDTPNLPFSPAISMDPVDGSKVSIKRNTPTLEYEGRIYHFKSAENMELFRTNPQKYLSGRLATY